MKLFEFFEGKSENRDLWDRIKSKGVVPSIDRERYTDMSDQGLEGPFRMKNGQVLYYDPKEGKYYNRDTDMYVDYDDYRKMDEMDKSQKGPAGWNISDDEPGKKQIHLGPKHMIKNKDMVKKVGKKLDKSFDQAHKGQGVAEGESQWGEPKDVLSQVLQTLEKEVEWPLTDIMDPQQVKQLLSPLMQAVSQKLNSLDEAEVGNTEYQFAHGKKPGGQGSWFFVAHRGGIDFGKDVEDQDYIQLHGMTYGEAKKAAVKWAKSKGHSQLFVAT